MQDKKYIPIIAATLVLVALLVGAYYIVKTRKVAGPEVGAPGQKEISEALKALAVPSGEKPPTQEELDKINKALAQPAPKGSVQTVPPADVIKALSQPAP